MASNPVVGACECPICKSSGAQVLLSSEGTGKPYLKCDECVSIIRTSSARGARELLTRATPDARAPGGTPPKPETPPAPKPEPKKKAGFFDMLKDA
jgi:hypothetical protein